MHFCELCKVFYPHPDAPEYAKVSVLEFLPVKFPQGFDTTAKFTIDASFGLQKISVLVDGYDKELEGYKITKGQLNE